MGITDRAIRPGRLLAVMPACVLSLLLASGCALFDPGGMYGHYPYSADPYGQGFCRDAWGRSVPCDPRHAYDARRCFNARGTAIFCRPGDATRPNISGSGAPPVAAPGYPYHLPPQRGQDYGYGPRSVDEYGEVRRAPDPTWQNELALPREPDYRQRIDPLQTPAAWPNPFYGRKSAQGPKRGGFILGVGDVINISVYGQPDMDTQAVISDSGYITVPLAGRMKVAGMTPDQAEQRIAAALQQGEYLVNPQVNVTLQEYRSRQISVVGQVQQPGRFTMERDLNLVDAIAQAQGTTTEAADYAVLIREGDSGPERFTVDLRNSLRGPNRQNFPQLRDGDTVFVPEAAKYYIYGQVNSPAEYPLRPGLTVLQALSIGGGLTELASVNKITIRRRGPDGLLRSFQAKLDDLVKPADVIFVDEGLF